jgi:hypothetical protein
MLSGDILRDNEDVDVKEIMLNECHFIGEKNGKKETSTEEKTN